MFQRLIRQQFTVTMFLIDVSPSMGKMRELELPLPGGKTQLIEMSNLEWSVQFVKLKIQEMVRVVIVRRGALTYQST